jgi:Flp pilus assembly protein TadG
VRRRPDPRSDEGTILFLVLGFVAILMLVVALVVNVSSVILAKRALASAADGAAVAAAQALDVDALYANGLGQRIPLDQGLAAQRVAAYQAQADDSQPGLRLAVDVSTDGTTAVVQAERTVDLPFGQMLGFKPVRVEAEARARAPTVP